MDDQFCWEILSAQTSEFSELRYKEAGSLTYNTFQCFVRRLFPESIQFSSVQLLSRVRLVATPCTATRQASLPITNSQVYPNSCPLSQWCHPTTTSSVVPSSSCPRSFPASGSFQMSQLRIRWPKDWSFTFSISPFNEHPGLISFRMDWWGLLAV